MKIIERANIDTNKWDRLVKSTPDSTVFSLSWYMDATAENWCIVTNDTYSVGMALPYTRRAGVEILYTPIFVRFVEWLGNDSVSSETIDLIRNRFKVIQFTCKQPVLGRNAQEYVYQKLDNGEERILGSQAKRSLKKAEKAGLSIEINTAPDGILNVIKEELSDKYSGINNESLKSLGILFERAREEKDVISFYVVNSEVEGGVVCIKSKASLLYLKGTVNETAKKAGGMYLAIHAAMEYAKENNLHFDFGGSRIEGVMRFNHNLGGKDTVYYAYTINNGPLWFKLARRIRNKWIKK